MTPGGDWTGESGQLISNRGVYSSRHLDPMKHLFWRIKSLLSRLETIIKQHDPSYERVVSEDSDDDDEEGSDEDVESDEEEEASDSDDETAVEKIFRLTGWSWDMIRAYLSLLEEYLINIGSSLDAFMNCKSSLLSSLLSSISTYTTYFACTILTQATNTTQTR